MLLWFAGMSVVLTWTVFRSPAVDYRMVALGAVLPVAEAATGRALVLHTLAGSVLAMTVVMLATRGRGRRLLRRRLIGVPIGLMLHLLLDGVWDRTEVFWWPFFGVDFPAHQVPELDRGLLPAVVLEVIGAATLVWAWRRFGLDDPTRRAEFVRTGQVDRTLAR